MGHPASENNANGNSVFGQMRHVSPRLRGDGKLAAALPEAVSSLRGPAMPLKGSHEEILLVAASENNANGNSVFGQMRHVSPRLGGDGKLASWRRHCQRQFHRSVGRLCR